MVLENPRVEQHEICEAVLETTGTEVSISTICRVLRKYGMTRKKIQSVAIQRSLHLRSRFMAHALAFPSHFFVWVDETGADRRNFEKIWLLIKRRKSNTTPFYSKRKKD